MSPRLISRERSRRTGLSAMTEMRMVTEMPKPKLSDSSNFVRGHAIHSRAAAIDTLRSVAKSGTSQEKRLVRIAVNQKHPSLDPKQ